MAYTSADLIVIERAIVRGETTVQFADRMVSYKSTSALLEAEQRIVEYLTGRRRGRIRTAIAKR